MILEKICLYLILVIFLLFAVSVFRRAYFQNWLQNYVASSSKYAINNERASISGLILKRVYFDQKTMGIINSIIKEGDNLSVVKKIEKFRRWNVFAISLFLMLIVFPMFAYRIC